MGCFYKCQTTKEEQEVLEALRVKLADVFGVTLQGNRITVRWTMKDALVNVHMIIENITTPTEAQIGRELDEAWRKLYAKYPDLEAELYHAEYGEWPK